MFNAIKDLINAKQKRKKIVIKYQRLVQWKEKII